MRASDVIAQVTEARTLRDAEQVMAQVRSRAVLLEACDLLYIEAAGRASATLRKAIAGEAREGMRNQAETYLGYELRQARNGEWDVHAPDGEYLRTEARLNNARGWVRTHSA